MAKLEWGQKRTCSSCGTRFYDMRRLPITCPKCGLTVEADLPFKVRRGGAAAAVAVEKVVPIRPPADIIELDPEELEVEDETEVDDDIDGGDADDSGLIEDASDLGEDDEDMAEVMEHLDENAEDEV